MFQGLDTAIIKEVSPFSLNSIMFIPTLIGQGTPDQQKKWIVQNKTSRILGTYAQVIFELKLIILFFYHMLFLLN